MGMNTRRTKSLLALTLLVGSALTTSAKLVDAASATSSNAWKFHLQEATIDDIHRGIHEGQVSCKDIVRAYYQRAKAFNGVATQLVTLDGKPIAPAPGVMRAGAPLKFPTATVKVSDYLPQFDQYIGAPLEFGRMEATASDPSVSQQFGIIVGINNA